MKWLRYIAALVAVSLSFSCGKKADPPITLLVPQIISTEVIPEVSSVTLYASYGGSSHFTDCGFGIVHEGVIREYKAVLDLDKSGFSFTSDGFLPETDYNFYAFIANGTSRVQTPQRPFRTLSPDPEHPQNPTARFLSVAATPATRTVLLTATISEVEDVTGCGFSLTADGVHYQDYEAGREGNGFSLELDGLTPSTQYGFLAWIIQRGRKVTSDQLSFRTDPETHSVSFVELSAVASAHSVQLTATLDDGSPVTYCGFGLSREGRTAVEYAGALNGNAFTVSVESLAPGMEYVYYAFVVVDGKRVTSEFARFTTEEDPSLLVMDLGATAGETSVTLRARLSRTDKVTSAGFALAGETGDFAIQSVNVPADGFLSYTWTGLTPGTAYRFYAWAQTPDGQVVSETMSFYTRASPGEVRFVSVSASVERTSALVRAVLSSTDGVTEAGIGLSSNQTDYVEYSAQVSEDGFQKLLSGLRSGTTYYCYAFFTHDGNYNQSEMFTFSIP